ncbi:hypothetical protein [Pseudomonas caspiana]|uniref:hypothetical protein n=1 Tax=Pseudomonas caspiana TaxID=1451454 RepID=UPI0032F0068C
MSLPESHQKHSRRELRKALVRLRMEMHRQEIRQESTNLMQPLRRVRGMTTDWQGALGIKHAPLWGVGVVSLLGFLGGKGAKGSRPGGLTRIVKLGVSLLPIIRLALGSSRKR